MGLPGESCTALERPDKSRVQPIMRPAPALLALFLAALAGCSEPVEIPTLAGEWTGTIRDATVRWTFNVRDTGNLTGTVVVSDIFDRSLAGTFSGAYDHPAVTLDISVTLDDDTQGLAEYYGTVNDEMSRMQGTVVVEELTYTLNLTRLP